MEKKELVGKQVFGFDFDGLPNSTPKMSKYIGKIGRITNGEPYCKVDFIDDWFWYPYPEILNHLVEDKVIEPELTLDEVLEQIKNLKP